VYKSGEPKQEPESVRDSQLLIDATQLETRIGERGLRILDCRFELLDAAAGRRHYMESHIPGAVFVDLEKDLSGAAAPELGRHPLPRPGALVDTFGRLGIDADTTVVLYDEASGAFAARAWWLLRWIGHEKAMLLDGGIEGWRTAGFATVSGGIEPERAYFRGTPRDELVLTGDEIERTGAAALCLVDARAAERFAGAVEPIDRIGGHIPGALNLPFSENLDVSGKWKSGADLRETYGALLGPDRSRSWAVMCGSGVTACHLVIGGMISGYREPRVYVGSWSEWITNSHRPIGRGQG
jgi:thiosulfate/3-mercaptopyruvate sulfurtransferase